MLLEHHLDLARIDVIAAGDDQLLDAPPYGERSIGRDLADVAGTKPAIHKGIRRGCGIPPVALEHLATLQLHFVELAEADLHAWQRIADAARLARPVVGVGDHDPALGDAVALEHGLSQDSLAALEEGCRQRGGPRHEEAHLPKVGWIL